MDLEKLKAQEAELWAQAEAQPDDAGGQFRRAQLEEQAIRLGVIIEQELGQMG